MSDREPKKKPDVEDRMPSPLEMGAMALADLANTAGQAQAAQDSPSAQNVWLRAFFHAIEKGSLTSNDPPAPSRLPEMVETASKFASLTVKAYQDEFPDDEFEPPKGKNPKEGD